jgi:hypothetical protein
VDVRTRGSKKKAFRIAYTCKSREKKKGIPEKKVTGIPGRRNFEISKQKKLEENSGVW